MRYYEGHRNAIYYTANLRATKHHKELYNESTGNFVFTISCTRV